MYSLNQVYKHYEENNLNNFLKLIPIRKKNVIMDLFDEEIKEVEDSNKSLNSEHKAKKKFIEDLTKENLNKKEEDRLPVPEINENVIEWKNKMSKKKIEELNTIKDIIVDSIFN